VKQTAAEPRVNSPVCERNASSIIASHPMHTALLAGWKPHKDIDPASKYDKDLLSGGKWAFEGS
jgi:hypothetical protein